MRHADTHANPNSPKMLVAGKSAIENSHGDRIDAHTAEAGWQAMIESALAEKR